MGRGRQLWLVVVACAWACAGCSGGAPGGEALPDDENGSGGGGAPQFCPPLAAPAGTVIDVAPGQSIAAAVAGAPAGSTILLADGTYLLGDDPIWFAGAAGLTLRSASGKRSAVVLDGEYDDAGGAGGVINIRADDVTIADLTIQHARHHAVHVAGLAGGTTGTRLYDLRVLDPGEQAIKINADGGYADGGELACSHIQMTRTGAAFVTAQTAAGSRCYTGGIDAHDASGWTVRDNWIEGFWCAGSGAAYLSEHAIHFWTGSRDTVVERNRLVDNTRGIGFGLGPGGRTYGDDPCPGVGDAGHYRGLIRNNFISAGDSALFSSGNGVQEGISLSSACRVTVVHNTIAFGGDALSAIEWRFDETSAEIANNLATHMLWDRGGQAQLSANLTDVAMSAFRDPVAHDLHLQAPPAAVLGSGDPGMAAMAGEDIDGETRGGAPDLGADELP